MKRRQCFNCHVIVLLITDIVRLEVGRSVYLNELIRFNYRLDKETIQYIIINLLHAN